MNFVNNEMGWRKTRSRESLRGRNVEKVGFYLAFCFLLGL